MLVAVVGGGSAIGQRVISHYLAQGAAVCAVCRSTKPVVGGCTVIDKLEELPEQIDVMVTLTGSVHNRAIKNMAHQDWWATINDTLTSVFEAIQAGTTRMKSGGSITVVGSIVGSIGGYECSNYAAAKAGLVGLVRAASNELGYGERGIRVNLLELGYVNAGMGNRLNTDQRLAVIGKIPMKRFAELDEVMKAIHFLAVDATYMTGGVLTYAGGMR